MSEQPREQPALLELRDVVVRYGSRKDATTALSGVSLSIAESPAAITTLAGESGSGKSTLANVVLGFTRPTTGVVRFRGRDVAAFSRRDWLGYRREVQAIFQDPFGVYNPFYRVQHVFTTAIRQFDLAESKDDARRLVADALEVVGLDADLLTKHPHQLSGGQRQRMMMARAFLFRPRLIVADEPVSMVDASLRATILSVMTRMRDELGVVFLYITHDLSTAYQVGDDIHILYRGEIVESGPTRQVIDNPQHSYSKLLVSSVPVPDPDVRWAAKASLAPGETTETIDAGS
jgi:ABC-type oligopeptide transport system ATPase subunit